MPWFEGSIPDAVAAAKSRKAIFVVFVEGQDEASKKTKEALFSSEVEAKLQSEDFVVIRIDSDGESFRQFAQIYHLVPVPSVFFIGSNGIPLEVVAGEVREDDLLRRIDGVLAKSGRGGSASSESASSSLIEAESTQGADLSSFLDKTSVASSSIDETPIATSDSPVEPPEPIAEEAVGGNEEEAAAPFDVNKTIEDRMSRARELIEQKKTQKREDEERETRNREIERRRVGQEVQKMRRLQQEQEAQQLAEQIKKDRVEEQNARQRVLQQIEQDKAERAARHCHAKEEEARKVDEEKRRAEQIAAARVADGARIQFRLPDGSTHTRVFPPNTQLAEVRAYAANNLQLPFRDFGMSTTFPRREFTVADNAKTVVELQLCPTAVILILPANRSEVVAQPGYFAVVAQLIWTLLSPLASFVNYMRGMFWGQDGTNPGSSTSRSPSPFPGRRSGRSQTPLGPNQDNLDNFNLRRRTSPADTATIRRQGNIHRLSNRQDSSDDDNNTWNGNSTQQM